jgi:hypothetical protein
MNNNPYNFKPGDKVQLDEGFANTSVVKIVSMTPQMLYSRVVPAEIENPKDEDAWDTMTDRLTPLKNGTEQ